MVLEHAPITGLTLLFTSISSTIKREQYAALTTRHYAARNLGGPNAQQQQAAADLSTWRRIRRLPLESLPFGPLGTSLQDTFLAGSVIAQMRALERRWGSNSFLSFLLTSSALGIAAMHVFVTESNSPVLSVDMLRVASAGGLLVPLVALATRYTKEIPSLNRLSLPGLGRFTITEKAMYIVPLVKLVLLPEVELVAQTHKRRAVLVDIGVWTRLLLALIGLLFGIASTRSTWLSWWLNTFSHYVCRPLINVLRPLLTFMFGATNVVEHAVPKHMQPGQGPHAEAAGFDSFAGAAAAHLGDPVVADGGRYTVDSLMGNTPAAAGADPFGMRRRPMPASRRAGGAGGSSAGPTGAGPTPSSSSTVGRGGRAGGSGVSRRRAVDPRAVQQIQELGLDASDDEIAAALEATGGDVNAAVHLLMRVH